MVNSAHASLNIVTIVDRISAVWILSVPFRLYFDSIYRVNLIWNHPCLSSQKIIMNIYVSLMGIEYQSVSDINGGIS